MQNTTQGTAKKVYDPRLVTAVKNAFQTFDQERSGQIEVREAGNAIRSLGVYATEAEIRQYIMEMQRENASLYIQQQSFVDYMCALISNNPPIGPTPAELEAAFKVLDPEGKGTIDEGNIRTLLASQGEKFSAEEIETFLGFARDAETGQIDWRAYARAAMEILWRSQ